MLPLLSTLASLLSNKEVIYDEVRLPVSALLHKRFTP